MLSSDLPKQINKVATQSVSAIAGRLLPRVGPNFDHCHYRFTVNQRLTDEGELIVYGAEISLASARTDSRDHRYREDRP